jgi:hypothetical protein
VFACDFGIGETLANYVRGDVLESSEIIHRFFPIVVSEHLFINVTEQMERFDADIGALQTTLEQTPEVLHSVSMNTTVNVPFRMVDEL